MYIVKLHNGKVETPIHNEEQKLKSGNVVKGVNAIDSFSFALSPSNVGFNSIFDFQTLVSVYNTNRNRYEFLGRVLYSNVSMDSDGHIAKEVTCESYFGFLCDSQQTYVAEQNWTVNGLFQHIIDTHNAQVEEYKRFTIGEVTVTDPNDNLYVGIQRENTWKTLEEKLLKKLGGEICFRVVDGVNYIDYLTEIGERRSTPIALSRNMKSITKEVDPSAYVTRLIPLGCKLNDTEERLDISSVNGGKIYIDDETAIAAYGIHVGYVEFDDVTTASALLAKGRDWLIENNRVQVKYSITALDLSLIGLEIDDFDVHNYHPIQNALLGIDDTARIIKKNINVCEEVLSTIEVGDNFKTLSDIQQEQIEQFQAASKNMTVIQSTTNDLKHKVEETQTMIENLDGEVSGIKNEELEAIRSSIQEQHTELINTSEAIILSALESYVETSNYEEFRQTVESQLTLLSNQMTVKFTETEERITSVADVLQTQVNEITKYFTFDINGLTIGQVDNPNKVVIDNDEISILVNGVEVQRFDSSGKALIPELNITKQLNMFGYQISEDGSGNVNCEYVGG